MRYLINLRGLYHRQTRRPTVVYVGPALWTICGWHRVSRLARTADPAATRPQAGGSGSIEVIRRRRDWLSALGLWPLGLSAAVERLDLDDVEEVMVDGVVGHPPGCFREPLVDMMSVEVVGPLRALRSGLGGLENCINGGAPVLDDRLEFVLEDVGEEHEILGLQRFVNLCELVPRSAQHRG